MTKHKVFGGAVLPLLIAATVGMVPGYNHGTAEAAVPSNAGAGNSTKATPGAAPGMIPNASAGRAASPTPDANPMDQFLELTPKQQAQNKAIFEDATRQNLILQSQQTLSPEEKNKRYQALNESVHRKMMAVLTPQQRSKLAAKQQEQMRAASGRFVATLDQELHLSPSQKVKMLSLVGRTMKQEQALGNNDALSFSQKLAGVRTIQQSMSAQMKALLTPQQLKTVEALNAQRMDAARARANGGQLPSATAHPQ